MEECFPGVELKGRFFNLTHNMHKVLKPVLTLLNFCDPIVALH